MQADSLQSARQLINPASPSQYEVHFLYRHTCRVWVVGNAISTFVNEQERASLVLWINGVLFTITINCGIEIRSRHEWKSTASQTMANYARVKLCSYCPFGVFVMYDAHQIQVIVYMNHGDFDNIHKLSPRSDFRWPRMRVVYIYICRIHLVAMV